MFGAMDLVKSEILVPNVGSSIVKTRYITSEGADDEQWLNYLKNESGQTDIWVMTPINLVGKDEKQREEDDVVGTFSKPLKLALDFFYDYKQGLDYNDTDPDNIVTNSEHEFLEKLFAVDLALESKRGCLGGNVYVDSWSFRLKIKRFQNASTHYANGILDLMLRDIVY